MILGALLDLGVDEAVLKKELQTVSLSLHQQGRQVIR